jgi:hypothetical protein
MKQGPGRSTKLCFLAPTGFGKTTIANLVRDVCKSAVNIKLAAPLYDLQTLIYDRIGISVRGEQDGELLQFLGDKIQREAPNFLSREFQTKLSTLHGLCPVITNDDCRPHNYPALKSLGFLFVRVAGYCRTRIDHSRIDPDHPIELGLDQLAVDFSIENTGSIEECRDNVIKLLRKVRSVK